MLEAAISGSALILIILLVRLIFRDKISRRLRYALWGLALLRLMLPFSIFSSSVSLMNAVENVRPYEMVQRLESFDKIELSDDGAVEGYHKSDFMGDFPVPIAPAKEFPQLKAALSAREILTPIWLWGALAVGLWFLITNLIFGSRLKKERKPLECGAKLPVFVTDGIDSPCLFGLFAPKIYLTPKAAASENIQHVLLHEYCHFLHGDNYWSVLRCICLGMYWWNPLVWAAAILSKHDGELACDEAVIKRIGEENRLAYGKTLVDMIALKTRPSNPMCAATTMTGGKKSIKARILAIAKRPKIFTAAVVFVALTALLAVGCTFSGSKEVFEPDVPFSVPFDDISLELLIGGEQMGSYIQPSAYLDNNLLNMFADYTWQELTAEEIPENLEDSCDYVLTLQFNEDIGKNTDHLYFFGGSDLVLRRENKADTWYKTSYSPDLWEQDEYSQEISLCRSLRLEYDEAELFSTRIRFVSEFEDFNDTAKLGIDRFCERLKNLSPGSVYESSDFTFLPKDIRITSSSKDEGSYTIEIPIRYVIDSTGTYPDTLHWASRSFDLQFSRANNNWWVLTVANAYNEDTFNAAELERLYKDYGMKLKSGSRNSAKLWNYIVKWTKNHEPDIVDEKIFEGVEDANTYTWYSQTDELAKLLYPAPVAPVPDENLRELFGDEPISVIITHSGIYMDCYDISYTSQEGEEILLNFVDGTIVSMTIRIPSSGRTPERFTTLNYATATVGYQWHSDLQTFPMPESLMLPGVFTPEIFNQAGEVKPEVN